ncbi:hypothetical protein J4404_02820 [Candidatus Woesearchaeota archaeon]|nr:hypothetical protein [Candidatus Woesearchaeota archaeon]
MDGNKASFCERCSREINHKGRCLPCNYLYKHRKYFPGLMENPDYDIKQGIDTNMVKDLVEKGWNVKEGKSEIKKEDNNKSKIHFNEDGSIKIPEHMLKNKQKEKESIVLRRVQINTNNPAIAHLRIEFPEDITNSKEILDYYEEIKDRRFPSVDHSIKKLDKRTFVIEVKNGTKYMYSLLDYLLACFESKLKRNKSVIVRGNWDKFDSN